MKKILLFLLAFVVIANGASIPQACAQHCHAQKNDSMWRLAKKYNLKFTEVLKLNKHYENPDIIHVGDKIEMPDGSEGVSNKTRQAEETQAQAVLRLVNEERKKQGAKPLALSEKLTEIANIKAKDMADKNYFAHESPTYGSPFQMLERFGVKYSYAGENIAAGQKSAEEVMISWMNSSGHRANILNKNYTELGVGFYRGGEYGVYWTQLFTKQ